MKNVKDMNLTELRKEMMELINQSGEDWKRRRKINQELRIRLKGKPGWTR